CRPVRYHLWTYPTANASAAREFLTANRARSVFGLLLFALSPIPSAQLFEAAGLMGVPLPPLVMIFFAGRLVSYSLYIVGASAVKKTNLGNLLVSSLTSPWGIAVQVAFLAGVVVLAHIDCAGLMVRRFRR